MTEEYQDKPLPAALSAEKSILSLMFQSTESINHTGRILGDGIDTEHFYTPTHQTLFEILRDRYRAGKFSDLVNLVDYLIAKGDLEKLGGASYIAEVYTYQPTSAHLSDHLKTLREKLAAREAIVASTNLIERSNDADADPQELAEALRTAQERISSVLASASRAKTAKGACGDFLAKFEDMQRNGVMPGLTCGVHELDEATGGMRSQDLWVVAGKPGRGKSVLMVQIAAEVLLAGGKVIFFSLEMSAEEIVARMISYVERLHADVLTKPMALDKLSLKKIKKAMQTIASFNLTINDIGGQTMDAIEAEARQESDLKKVDLLVIDYFQIITNKSKSMSKLEKLEDTSGRLKQLAKTLNTPILTGSQLNDDGLLKGCRKIGEDANVALTIVREENDRGEITSQGLRVDKNRNGASGMLLNLIHYDGYNRFAPNRAENSKQKYNN